MESAQSVYWFALACLFTGLLFAGLSKLVYPKKVEVKAGTKVHALQQAMQSQNFAIVQIYTAFALWAVENSLVRLALASMVLALVIGGIAVRKLLGQSSCDCYGELTPKSPTVLWIVDSIFVLCALLVAQGTHSFQAPNAAVQLMIMLISCLLLICLFAQAARAAKAKASSQKAAAAPKQLSGQTELGWNPAGQLVTLSQIAEPNKPFFVVGVSSRCEKCKKLVPDIAKLANAFGKEFPIAVICNDDSYLIANLGSAAHFFIDQDRRFASNFEIETAPFGVLINGSNLSVMAPPSHGQNAIRTLFSVLLNARTS
jgi:thiol-disulfide isomerase/thioredoxin